MEVCVVYRQDRKWFGRLGPKEVFAVYADALKAQDCVDSLSGCDRTRFTIETRNLVYGRRVLNKARKDVALEILSDYGKRLLGIAA